MLLSMRGNEFTSRLLSLTNNKSLIHWAILCKVYTIAAMNSKSSWAKDAWETVKQKLEMGDCPTMKQGLLT